MKSHFHVSSLSNHWIQSVDLKCYHFFFRMIVSWMFQPCATDAAVPSVAIQMSRKDKIALPCHPLKANLILSEDQCLYPRRPHALPVLITMDLKLQHPLPFLKARPIYTSIDSILKMRSSSLLTSNSSANWNKRIVLTIHSVQRFWFGEAGQLPALSSCYSKVLFWYSGIHCLKCLPIEIIVQLEMCL